MVDLSTTYLGLNLKNPLVASASPLSKKVDSVRKLEDAGVSAVVMYSLFEEQINLEGHELNYFLERGTYSFPEALTQLPEMPNYNVGPEKYLELIRRLKETVQIPIIASLNGSTTGGWVEYARRMEQAGADALELNLYSVQTNPALSSMSLEQEYADLILAVRSRVHIPLAIKLSPFFTSLPNMAERLVKSGANALVLFNRFYQPDLDIETLEVVPNLQLSTSADLRLPLRWIAILYGRLQADLALTSGVHTPQDIVKAMMAGANVAMTTSALLHHGPEYASTLLAGLEQWMQDYEYESIQQMRGSMSQQAVADPAAFERANYMKALNSIDYRLI
jgi:dihydroorotate dehydrogenase (fumarate)